MRESATTVEETRTGGLGIRCEGVVHLYKTFGGHDVVALRGVDLTIRPGERVAFLGPSGSGKSTLVNAMAGVIPARAGEVLLDGTPVHELAAHQVVGQGIALVPEGRLLFNQLTVAQNLQLGAYLRKDSAGIAKDIERAYELFPILGERR